MVRTTRNLELFDKKPGFFLITIFDKELMPFWKMLLWLKLLLNAKFKDYHLSVFQKLRYSDTCNQVKSCTKHGRPGQSHHELTIFLMEVHYTIT